MDGLSAVTSVIAVVDISIKIVTICSQYYKAVAGARDDVQRLQTQVIGLQTTLNRARDVIESPKSTSLTVSREFSTHLDGCWVTLQGLLDKLEPKKKRNVMHKFGLRALKWPFNRKEMEATMSALEQYQRRMMDSLQIDQTNILLNIEKKIEQVSIQPQIEVPVGEKPHFLVPFPKDVDFISRPEIQSWIREQYAGTRSRLALIGIGGIGKSQLAIDFAHETHWLQPECSIFWVYGVTNETLVESYRSIANQLMIPGHDDPKANVLVLVRDWLQREQVAPWLMILDNADKVATYFEEMVPSPLASYLPKGSKGKILITSRSMTVAEKLTGSFKAIKQINQLQHNEGLQLLENKLCSEFDETLAGRLLESLDCIPLAISQAAAYVNRRKISLKTYLERFESSEKKRHNLLSYDAGDISRHEGVSNSVAVTWQVTFEQILQEKTSAANLLALMSWFQPQNIPEWMLWEYNDGLDNSDDEDEGYDDGEDTSDSEFDLSDDHSFIQAVREDMDILMGYSLVRESESEVYEMHPLVQVCTQAWQAKLNKKTYWDKVFLRQCATGFPKGEYETWTTCRMLLPHVKPILAIQPIERSELLHWAQLLRNTSWFYFKMGRFKEAEVLAKNSVTVRSTQLGDMNKDTLDSKLALGTIYSYQERLQEAKEIEIQILEQSIALLGEKDCFTIASKSNLSATYKDLGQLEDAQKLQLEILEACKAQSEGVDGMALVSMSNLASIYNLLGRFEEAEKLFQQVVDLRIEREGDAHPDTISSMNDLAVTLGRRGEWKRAEELQLKVIENRKLEFGDTHPETLTNLKNLAFVLSHQDRKEESDELLLKVLTTQKELLGEDHPDTLATLSDFAIRLNEKGSTVESAEMLLQVLKGRREELGNSHPKTIDSIENLAIVLQELDRLEEATVLMQECVALLQGLPGSVVDIERCKSALQRWEQQRG